MVKDDEIKSWREEIPDHCVSLNPCRDQIRGPFAQFNGRSVETLNDIHYEVHLNRSKSNNRYVKRYLYCELHVECSTPLVCGRLRELIEPELARLKCELIPEWGNGKNGHFAIRRVEENGIDSEGEDIGEIRQVIESKLVDLVDRLEPIISSVYEKYMEERRSKVEDCKIQEVIALLESSGQVVLTGAPGTGKTFTACKIAERMAETGVKGQVKRVQFHPGYDYSDFVIGLKPRLVGGKGKEQVTFEWMPGVFKRFADDARKAYDAAADKRNAPKFVMVVDEINRADLSRVFGELFSVLEVDYRYRIGAHGEKENESGVQLPDGSNLVVPENLYIVGTMNDIDRSVDSMDFALRRRFVWYEVTAEMSKGIIETKLKQKPELAKKCKNAMDALNGIIRGEEAVDLRVGLGPEYELGGAIFANAAKDGYEDDPGGHLWNNHIRIVLSEYLRGNKRKSEILARMAEVYSEKMGTRID